MKQITLISVILMAELFATSLVQAQGTVYVSNLGETSAGNAAVGSDSWIGLDFGTGTNVGGYSLNTIKLLMSAASGAPTGFSVSIRSEDPNRINFPGSIVGSLSGPDPAAGGVFSYDAAGIFLAPRTGYYIVLTAATPVADGAYSSSFTTSFNGEFSDNWGGLGFPCYSSNGLVWGRLGASLFQFALYATPVPEPSTLALFSLGSVALAWAVGRRMRKSRGTHHTV